MLTSRILVQKAEVRCRIVDKVLKALELVDVDDYSTSPPTLMLL
jgi:hypothetical protein